MAGPLLGLVLALAAGGVAELDSQPEEAHATEDGEALAAIEELLGQLVVAPESEAAYDRRRFRHWSDLDQDGCDTRQEVLLAERGAGTVDGCEVADGHWYSTYDGMKLTDPRGLDVDHVVALGEAWDSGADVWDDARRERYANDLGYRNSLIAVTARSNRQKSDKDPTEWVPTRRAAWCRYATAWTTVKIRWGLSADVDELAALRELFAECRRPPVTVVPLAR